ncbi:MAG: M50 family metallopeptidase [Kineosporiaceae bacterium]|nr:M50 family metallopeptidase [Kineosporiaceae bacterium]
MDWVGELRLRVLPVAGDVAGPDGRTVAITLAAASALVFVPGLWSLARVAVTLVHELGHALVGMAVGRRFTGFVVRNDMSGHAVTAGRPRGPGLVLTTWAGYPAPALVGAGLVWTAVRGWSAPVLTGALLIILLAVLRIRSAYTALVMAAALGGLGALWWWRADGVQQQVLIAAGLLLIVGAWRHVLAVMSAGSGGDDPAVLARLTGVPRLVWSLSYLAVAAGSAWLVVGQLTGL